MVSACVCVVTMFANKGSTQFQVEIFNRYIMLPLLNVYHSVCFCFSCCCGCCFRWFLWCVQVGHGVLLPFDALYISRLQSRLASVKNLFAVDTSNSHHRFDLWNQYQAYFALAKARNPSAATSECEQKPTYSSNKHKL